MHARAGAAKTGASRLDRRSLFWTFWLAFLDLLPVPVNSLNFNCTASQPPNVRLPVLLPLLLAFPPTSNPKKPTMRLNVAVSALAAAASGVVASTLSSLSRLFVEASDVPPPATTINDDQPFGRSANSNSEFILHLLLLHLHAELTAGIHPFTTRLDYIGLTNSATLCSIRVEHAWRSSSGFVY